MATVEALTRRFEKVFEAEQAAVLAESITEAYGELVKTSDFSELKAIVKELAQAQHELTQAQQRTEMRVDDLAKDMQELTRVVTNMGQRMDQMGQRMDQMGQRMDQMGQRMDQMAGQMGDMRSEIGGMSRSMAYALENNAYRYLPAFLKRRHGITLSERVIRTDIGGEEINFFALGERNGDPICLVGESKLQLYERRSSRREAERIIAQLEHKVDVVRQVYPNREIVRLLVIHYARPAILDLF